MIYITFTGEESARFVRFSQIAIEAQIPVEVSVKGREPLTSRIVQLHGIVTNGIHDGYLRYIVLRETGSDVEYWIAGSNSTRSIACREIVFLFSDESFGALQRYARAKSLFLPGIGMSEPTSDPILIKIDEAVMNRSADTALFLLNVLSHENENVVLEAALSLRAFASLIVASRHFQREAEQKILATLQLRQDKDIRISVVEDLGYIGTEASVMPLSELLRDTDEHNHVRWAAAIALGRLPTEDAITSLLPGLQSDFEWTVAATVLSLSRRAEQSNKELLEPLFAEHLSTEKDVLLRRYACLGLSKFNSLAASTLASLRDVIGDPDTSIDLRGYAALAIAASLRSCPEDFRNQIGILLESVGLKQLSGVVQPEEIWGLEYIADLASLLELNKFSAEVNDILSRSFSDWRSAYYASLSFYEQAEAAARRGDGEQGSDLLEQSYQALPSLESVPEDVRDAIVFRRDIVRARQQLISLIYRWEELIHRDDLKFLEEELREVSRVYARYATVPKRSSSSKQLSDRELQYLRNTKRLVETVGLLVGVDSYVRSEGIDINNLRQRIFDIIQYLRPLEQQFSDSFACSLNNLVKASMDSLNMLDDMLEEKEISFTDKLRRLRAVIVELRSLFQRASWPMPARVCPVFGLGKGTVRILKEDLLGDGAESGPFLYPLGTPVILNVQTEIQEMVPGGSTTALVICSIAGSELKQHIPVVEGPYLCSFALPDTLSPVVSIRVTVSLRFEARDCNQIASSVTAYLRRQRQT